MILNVKARFRDPKPPLWMADYTTGAWIRNPKYKLTMEEHDILTVFRNEYTDRAGYNFLFDHPLMHYWYLGFKLTSRYAAPFQECKVKGILYACDYQCHEGFAQGCMDGQLG